MHNLGVRFRVAGVGPFLSAKMADFTGKMPSLFEVFGSSGTDLSVALRRAEAREHQVELLNGFFLVRVRSDGLFSLVRSAVDWIENRFGRYPVAELASALGTSERTLDRGFARHVGLSPKVLIRITRFQFVLRRLMDAPDTDLASLSSEAGYFDQSHLFKDFRAMTGGVPRGYRGYYPKDSPGDFAPNVVVFLQDGDGGGD